MTSHRIVETVEKTWRKCSWRYERGTSLRTSRTVNVQSKKEGNDLGVVRMVKNDLHHSKGILKRDFWPSTRPANYMSDLPIVLHDTKDLALLMFVLSPTRTGVT